VHFLVAISISINTSGARCTKSFGKKFIHSICRAVTIIEFLSRTLSPGLAPATRRKSHHRRPSSLSIAKGVGGGTGGHSRDVRFRNVFTRREFARSNLKKKKKKRKKKEKEKRERERKKREGKRLSETWPRWRWRHPVQRADEINACARLATSQ
jgi:hypothetical protein